MSFDPKKPYNELPLLPPKIDIETPAVLKKAISANRKLAELKGSVNLIPNQQILINTLILNEAKDSSEIENIITTQDELYKAFSAEGKITDPATKEVMRYREALQSGYDELNKREVLSINTILKAHEILIGHKSGIRKGPGTVLQNEKTKEIIYKPPDRFDVLINKLNNIEQYLNSVNGVDPLIKLAVLHYQFEAIHPFSDGNGRIGRILNILYLIHEKLLDLPVLYLSSYIIRNKSQYYQLLLNVTKQNEWEKWILYMLDAVETTSSDTIEKVNKIKELLSETIDEIKEKLPKIYSKELAEVLFYQPYCKIKYLQEKGIAHRQTASEYLKALENIGILESRRVGREVLYLNKKLFGLWGN